MGLKISRPSAAEADFLDLAVVINEGNSGTVKIYYTSTLAWFTVMKPYPTARMIDDDRRNRFPVGMMKTTPGLHDRIARVAGGDIAAGFVLGTLIFKHVQGHFGCLSAEDRVLNEYVLKEHVLRGTTHVIVSRHIVHGIPVEIVTDLGECLTRIRPGSAFFRRPIARPKREATDAAH